MTKLETVVVLLVVVPLIPIAWARVELLQWGLQPGDKSLILNQPFPPAAAYRVPDLALGFMVGFVITWFVMHQKITRLQNIVDRVRALVESMPPEGS